MQLLPFEVVPAEVRARDHQMPGEGKEEEISNSKEPAKRL